MRFEFPLERRQLARERADRFFEFVGMHHHFLNCLGVGVILVLHHPVRCKAACCRLAHTRLDDASRHPHHRGLVGHILHHDRVRPHLGAVAHPDRPEDLGARTDHTLRPSVGWRLPLFQVVPPSVTP